MSEKIYPNLSDKLQKLVDEIIAELEPMDWPARFEHLVGWLATKLRSAPTWDMQAGFYQLWPGIVAAVFEKLPPDPDLIECQALMCIAPTQWRTMLMEKMDRDPSVEDRIAAAYPGWPLIVDTIKEAYEEYPIEDD
ncbi:MAG: hypothetical protein PHE83_16295 [Opitutaceae bacterium]|nr:hypothetical protein [Opitutaceae bacterium]